VRLNPDVVASDVHEFRELLDRASTLPPTQAAHAFEAALALYRGDLLDSPDVPNFHWMYDAESAQVGEMLRGQYRLLERGARLHLAELLAAGQEDGLGRAAELYASLCAEEPEDERLWTALFRVYEREGSLLGLESAVRRLQLTLAELAPGKVNVETMPLPPKLDRLVQEIRARIGAAPASHAGALGD
jgi:DNA-binding SARP family transcriptional activator